MRLDEGCTIGLYFKVSPEEMALKIIKPKHISDEDLKQLINDTEATLIFCCRNQLIYNTIYMNPVFGKENLSVL